MVDCLFCGAPARTKEHVWPKWLRGYPGFSNIDVGLHGERFRRTEFSPLPADPNATAMVPQRLSNVTAPVCSDCNNGWMSLMESRVKAILDAAMRTDEIAGPALTKPEQTVIAAWFTKCAYAYDAAIVSEANQAWPRVNYRDLKTTQEAPSTATIWLGKNIGHHADMIMSVTPIYMIPIESGATHEPGPPKVVGAWMSANTVVVYGLWMTPDMIAANLPRRLGGADVDAMTQIWPPASVAPWPAAYTSDPQAERLINMLATFRNENGIPIDLLTHEQIDRAKGEMRANADREGSSPPYAIVNRVRASLET